ncbi:MAG: aldo/keto reductase, partial [Serratia proteamaculans]
IGLSEASVATLERAHKVHPITALQTEYSLWTRDAEQGVLAACERLGIGFVPYSPLGRGFLTGAIQRPEDLDADDFRRSNPRFQGENFARNLALVEKVTELAKQKGVAPSQLALAWVLAQGEHIVPIPGTKRRRYLEENIAAAELTLNKAELAAIEAVFPLQAAAGARYGAESMTYING